MDLEIELQDDNIEMETSGSKTNIEVEVSDTISTSTDNYNSLKNKPSINGIELVGDKTTEDLGIKDGKDGTDGYTPVKGKDYFTESEIQQIKQNILDDINSFDLVVVEKLPTEKIKEKTIYLVPNADQKENNVYDEYIYVNEKWEVIGSTAVDTDDLTINLVENSYTMIMSETTETGATIQLPASYRVGMDRLDVYYNGEKLIKIEDEEGHYYEQGTTGVYSNTIKLAEDFKAEIGSKFEFVIRTNGTSEKPEEVYVDTLPINAIIDYDGDEVPDGYEEVDDKGEVYSTEEIRIGTWIDGKPIYRKVIETNLSDKISTSASDWHDLYTDTNISGITNLFFKTIPTTENFTYINRFEQISFYFANGIIQEYHADEFNNNRKIILIIEYTKTTD